MTFCVFLPKNARIIREYLRIATNIKSLIATPLIYITKKRVCLFVCWGQAFCLLDHTNVLKFSILVQFFTADVKPIFNLDPQSFVMDNENPFLPYCQKSQYLGNIPQFWDHIQIRWCITRFQNVLLT